MKVSQLSLLAACAPLVTARFIELHEEDQVSLTGASEELFLIETAPGETRWVTDEGKWELRRKGQKFIDVTNHPSDSHGFAHTAAKKQAVVFPTSCSQQAAVAPLAAKLTKANMKKDLKKLTSFYTRHYTTESGLQSSQWVLSHVQDIVRDSGADDAIVSVRAVDHAWKQKSVIATIRGKSNDTVVIGAHQDSTNLWLPTVMAAPGADDDGSGSVTIMEVLRALLASDEVRGGEAPNTIEFHWYSAEEAGLLGSQDVFSAYADEGRVVKAMLQQDMTGYVKGTLDKGEPESVGVIVDYVDKGLTNFIKIVIDQYCNISWVETKCGYACSDHASASKYGFPSAFVIESAFENSDPHIHSTDDQIKYLSFEHMHEHAKMTLGLVYELGFYHFSQDP